MDGDLAQLREQRLAQLKQTSNQSNSNSMPAGMKGMPGPQDQQKQQEAAEMRRQMLSSILNSEARERLARISIVKEDKARKVEEMLLRMAQQGQIRGKVTEQQLIDLLAQISQSEAAPSKITFSRRRMDDSESDEDFGF